MSDTSLLHSPKAANSRVGQADGPPPRRILLVEGDGFTRLVLLLRLRLAGFGVDFTSNGILGLGKLRNCNPDILLVELRLCGMSGIELIKAARSEPTFGNRPVYVFTHADRMNRTARKEMKLLATKVFDKNSVTREDLVKSFSSMFLSQLPAGRQPPSTTDTELATKALTETALSGALEEIVAGVRQQSEVLARETGNRAASGRELLSRVCSLASCAGAARVPNLTRQAKALENYLNQLGSSKQGYTDAALGTITRAVKVMDRIALDTSFRSRSLSRFGAVLVDESTASNRSMKEALLNAGLDPVCFQEPARGREYLGSHRTDLILVNVALPEAHSLRLAEIRQFPLHAQTTVLFGPESRLMPPLDTDVPSAARLDTEPLLRAELVLSALNELQEPAPPPVSPVSFSPNPAAVQQRSLTRPRAVESRHVEDSFALFAQTQRPASTAALHSPAQSAAFPAETIHQPFRWSVDTVPQNKPIQESPVEPTMAPEQSPGTPNHVFTAEDIPNELFLRAEPATPAADRVAELQVTFQASQIDGIQIDERPVEVFSLSALQAEPFQPPETPPVVPDQAIANVDLAAASQADEALAESYVPSELESNEAAATEESAAAKPIYKTVMKNQLQADPMEHLRQGGPSQPVGTPKGRQTHLDELASRVRAADAALYRSESENKRKDSVIEALRQQLAAADAQATHAGDSASAEPNAAAQNAEARCAELEQEVASLRQALEDFNGNFGQQQQDASEASRNAQELEQRLNQAGTDLQQQREEQQRTEAELRQQLEAANTVGEQSETARQQAEAHSAGLELELGALRQAHEDLAAKLAQEQKAGAESAARLNQLNAQATQSDAGCGAPASDLEDQVRQGVAALARATAELAKERGERQRSQQRAADLNGRLQAMHEDLRRTLEGQREDLARISALDEEQRQTKLALDARTADLEQQQAERRLAEEQLQKTKEANAQLRKDLSFFDAANRKFDGARQELQNGLETTLSAARQNEVRFQQEATERQRLADSLEAAQRELQNQSRKRETLEQELKTAHDALEERELKLQKEAAERQRLNEALNSARRNSSDGSERDLEFSKLQSALELELVERKRLETQLARLRHSALDSAHSTRALRTTLRRQVRQPLDNVANSARSLLELPMDEPQKKLAEAVLEDVLLVQTRLREPEPTHGETPEAAATSGETTT
jgi:DNA-binding response OmpR family regulator